MEDNFNQNDFEEFLQDSVRNHRMYPADSVWREIDKKLHGEKRWPALTIAALILLSATVLICVYFTPKPNILTIQPANVNTSTRQIAQNNNILNNLAPAGTFVQEKPRFTSPIQNTTPASSPSSPAVPSTNDASEIVAEVIEREPVSNAAPHIKASTTSKLSVEENQSVAEKHGGSEIASQGLASAALNEAATTSVAVNSGAKVQAHAKPTPVGESASAKDYNDKNMVDDFLKEHKADVAQHTSDRKTSFRNRFSYQLYFAPSVSYRKLLEDHSMLKENNGGPVGLNYVTDVNKVVRHKPGTGIELGVSFMYSLSDIVRLKSGFQFNMRQYSIEAYRAGTEVAIIALMTGNRIDTINTVSYYRNNNGYSSAELVNRYFQVSMPIGIEWEIVGNKKVQLNVAGTIQPTYLLNRDAYLLTTNFKNYTERPGMIRQWNLNSNIEAFVSFKVGDFKWQLGPQLRYQPYSTFIPEYSIKEHLMDYGIKLGVSHPLK